MSEKKLLALLSLGMAVIGGILVLANVFLVSRSTTIDADYLATRAVDLILGFGAIVFGIYMYKGHMSTGGLLAIVVGMLILVDTQRIGLDGALVLLGGILGLIVAQTT